jgi:DNA-binding transcriptional ArsR family regulator
MQKVFNKSKLKENGELFIALPSDIRHYVYLDGYKSEMSYLYGLIVDYYNVDKCYAFPSQYTLAKDYGKSEKTVVEHLKVLKSVGLIDVFDNGKGKVNYYKPLVPLTKDVLFVKFPKAAEKYEKVQREKERLAATDKLKLWATGE